ncbi:FMN-binding negative transcriptional regulator [Caballeronia sp. dw_276]|jgi:transcriptional regulator|uniref:FMN-binding negative transcriptional regulator n=1 Tax=Caballeronia sp. dw_276 TaxID=2719795 RepID=UPI001BD3BA32|nr:FMN-binding negative transcriptional regulator [Caballeronia sp. dw_276]
MYLPAHFAETRVDELHRLMNEYPLAALVTNGPDGLDANHVPFELDASVGSQGVLRAHVARANPVWKEVADGAEVLVIFRGPEHYISPNWYPSKHEAHRQVPTWNYQVVHAHGKITIRDDEKFLRGLVGRLTRVHEAGEEKPWKMGDSARDYIDSMLQAIVGIEIEITRLVGKSKLGQNKERRDIQGAIDGLRTNSEQPLADAMSIALAAKPE